MAGALPGLGQSAYGENTAQTGIATSPATATAQFRLNVSGLAESAPNSGVFAERFRWLTGCGPPDNYWVRSVESGGNVFSSDPSNGAWIALSATRTWARNRTSDVDGTTTAVATFDIATDAAGVQIIATFTITLNATVIGGA